MDGSRGDDGENKDILIDIKGDVEMHSKDDAMYPCEQLPTSPSAVNLDSMLLLKSDASPSPMTMEISPKVAPSNADSALTLAGDETQDVIPMDEDLEENALDLDGLDVVSGTVKLSISSGTFTPQDEDRARSSSPPVSTSSVISSSFSIASSASSSVSSVHSSFSNSQKPVFASSTLADVSATLASSSVSSSETISAAAIAASSSTAPAIRNLPKRSRIPSPRAVGSDPTVAPLRPLGPAHLEHDYTRARHELSVAVAIAAYELYHFALPLRDSLHEARRPTSVDIPKLREHRAVQKAAKKVDEADKALEEALKRGQTWENTEVPACWRWGSEDERLQDAMGWAYLEPEARYAKRRRGRRTRAEKEAEMKARMELGIELEEDMSIIKTRGQKRRAPMDEDDEGIEAEAEDEDGDEDISEHYEGVTQKPRSVSLVKLRGRPPVSRHISTSSAPGGFSFSRPEQLVAAPKRPRGRPPKHPVVDTDIRKASFTSTTASPSSLTVKLKPSAGLFVHKKESSHYRQDSSTFLDATPNPARSISSSTPGTPSKHPVRFPPNAKDSPSVLKGAEVPSKRPRGRPRKHALPGTVLINGFCVPLQALEAQPGETLDTPSDVAAAVVKVQKAAEDQDTAVMKERMLEDVLKERGEHEDPNSRRSKRAKIDVSYRE